MGVSLRAACEEAGISCRDLANDLFLSWDQARTLAGDPLATIGNHTVSHATLGSLSDSAAEKYQEILANPTTRLFGIIIAWQCFGQIFRPIFNYSLHLLYPHTY